MTACGHVRSGRSIGGNARYRWNGIGEGAWWFACRLLVMVSLRGWRRAVPEDDPSNVPEHSRTPQRGGPGQASLRQRRRRLCLDWRVMRPPP
jgi:hypothetical protein